ncbi:Unknown (Se83) [Spodoptera exigua multiple nucleopolyhedrovirus]|nr:Unknown (Se83) [Spodoptera exigua multiple nucleopolyhedrovirus]CDG72561.1 Unknown (Se83) [Spodoptera exigua multiple nucleopolyhedrovirus]CDG72698.1 Unknown (Se83) [Spodoptera exigua multiple nucleopolyhedrovirus]CDG72835.1 Unknown (Se83) [Spodoptera exigua multiple nucleopolyhedrovirus]CDG72987.1 Unknown (Se83) [Spodoptera exigua multiple nucleopolyhedrovirus]
MLWWRCCFWYYGSMVAYDYDDVVQQPYFCQSRYACRVVFSNEAIFSTTLVFKHLYYILDEKHIIVVEIDNYDTLTKLALISTKNLLRSYKHNAH